jgi:hypothetical protein
VPGLEKQEETGFSHPWCTRRGKKKPGFFWGVNKRYSGKILRVQKTLRICWGKAKKNSGFKE